MRDIFCGNCPILKSTTELECIVYGILRAFPQPIHSCNTVLWFSSYPLGNPKCPTCYYTYEFLVWGDGPKFPFIEERPYSKDLVGEIE